MTTNERIIQIAKDLTTQVHTESTVIAVLLVCVTIYVLMIVLERDKHNDSSK